MPNKQQQSMGGFSEHNERTLQHIERDTATAGFTEEQMLLDYLLETGFVWEEASKLLRVREQLYENAEMRERMSDDYRMHFARWLYEQGEVSEQ